MLGKFLTLLLEKNVFTSTSASEDILKQSGTMQYMEPELLSVIDDIRLAENSINDAIAGCVSDMETIRTGLYMDSRRFPEALRDTLPSGEGTVAAVRFVMEYPPCHNYTVKNPFGDLARSIEKSCADLEDVLNRITEAGY